MPIPPKTAHSLDSSLKGSSFRRIYYDGRIRFIRAIMTLGRQSRGRPHPAKPASLGSVPVPHRLDVPVTGN
jgi:hypothetical protein